MGTASSPALAAVLGCLVVGCSDYVEVETRSVRDLTLDGRNAEVRAMVKRHVRGQRATCSLRAELEWDEDDDEQPIATLIPPTSIPCEASQARLSTVTIRICAQSDRTAELAPMDFTTAHPVVRVRAEGEFTQVETLTRTACEGADR